jgi:hypothetical protein
LASDKALSQKAATAAPAEPFGGIVAVWVLDVCVRVVAALPVVVVVVVLVVVLGPELPPQPATTATLAAAINNGEYIRRLIRGTPSGRRWTTMIEQCSRRRRCPRRRSRGAADATTEV